MLCNGSIADFLDACGATGPIEVHLEETAKPGLVRHVFPQPFLVLGRDPRADLPLIDGEVSKRHAYLQVIGGSIFCVDLQSRTGLNWAHGLGKRGWLLPAQAVRVGPFKIQLTGGVPADPFDRFNAWNPLRTFPAGQETLPGVIVERQDRPHREFSWRMNCALALVGQAEDCKLCIRKGAVSRHCCSLVNTPAGVWVVDLLGGSGTYVNEKPVRWAHLNEGDSLCVGGMVLRIRYEPTRNSTAVSPTRTLALQDVSMNSLVPNSGQDPDLVPVPASADQPIPTPLSGAAYQGLAIGMPVRNDAASALLGPIASQFALMQQQMFDQFMQALMAMGQMFGQLHRDQLNLIREELTRVQEVNQNLQMLHMELARRGPGSRDDDPPRLTETRPERPASSRRELEGRLPSPSPLEAKGPRKSTPPETKTVANGGGRPPSPATVPPSPEDVHAQLSQRVLALQQERESLWQQLLNRLLGRGSGETQL